MHTFLTTAQRLTRNIAHRRTNPGLPIYGSPVTRTGHSFRQVDLTALGKTPSQASIDALSHRVDIMRDPTILGNVFVVTTKSGQKWQILLLSETKLETAFPGKARSVLGNHLLASTGGILTVGIDKKTHDFKCVLPLETFLRENLEMSLLDVEVIEALKAVAKIVEENEDLKAKIADDFFDEDTAAALQDSIFTDNELATRFGPAWTIFKECSALSSTDIATINGNSFGSLTIRDVVYTNKSAEIRHSFTPSSAIVIIGRRLAN